MRKIGEGRGGRGRGGEEEEEEEEIEGKIDGDGKKINEAKQRGWECENVLDWRTCLFCVNVLLGGHVYLYREKGRRKGKQKMLVSLGVRRRRERERRSG